MPEFAYLYKENFFFDSEYQQPLFIAQRAQEPWRSFLSN